jgi:uncharacterized 2Fe-2S/4Fe-4S cluster protein (DUF4445 family)
LSKYKIHFLPGGKSALFEQGTNFRDAALELGIIIESSCAGIGTCAKCKVLIQKGDGLITKTEEELLTPKEIEKGTRLSCQVTLQGDSVCLIPQTSQLFGDAITTEGAKGIFPLDPDTKKYFIRLPKPLLGQKYFDFNSLLDNLQGILNKNIDYDFKLTRELSDLLREDNFELTAVLDQNKLRGYRHYLNCC